MKVSQPPLAQLGQRHRTASPVLARGGDKKAIPLQRTQGVAEAVALHHHEGGEIGDRDGARRSISANRPYCVTRNPLPASSWT